MSFSVFFSTYFYSMLKPAVALQWCAAAGWLSLRNFCFGTCGVLPCRVRQVAVFVPPFSSGPVCQPEHLSPALQPASRVPLPQMLQGRLSRLGDAVGREHLPQAQLIGGHLLVAIDAVGMAQDRAILCTYGVKQRFQQHQAYLSVDGLFYGRPLLILQ